MKRPDPVPRTPSRLARRAFMAMIPDSLLTACRRGAEGREGLPSRRQTAKALELAIPSSVLGRADEVIQ